MLEPARAAYRLSKTSRMRDASNSVTSEVRRLCLRASCCSVS